MADTALQTWISPEQYLANEELCQIKHEFVDGCVYARVGGTARHNLITGNLYTALRGRLASPCLPFATDVKLQIKSQSTERFYYPDVFVSCAQAPGTEVARDDAVLVAEVLSPSTERHDREGTFDGYRMLPSIEEYLLLAQAEPLVELFRKRTNWEREVFGAGESIQLESVDVSISVNELYRDVQFDS